MNETGILIAFAFLAIGIVASRLISERAFRVLDDQMKLAVMNEFSGMRIWNLIPVLAIVLLMTLGNSLFAGHPLIAFSGLIGALIAYFAITHMMIRVKLVKLNVPGDYLRALTLSRWISYLSVCAMLVVAFLS